ncbi:SDR family NAD(P)-dependent oxidoreductase [Brevibacterium sp.]|uniref:SDR family NAD(P)-dependent oxidoreductase n=1 Tax=Brevibacterium sp. TaxID=1701 RepID=UPI002811FF25|nr:SDR family NAD(P)-dependent oxidoreductase [Brevibacterium sp.]
MKSCELEGKVVLVFGAGSSGVGLSNGEATALAYADAGASVAAIDVNRHEAERVAARIADVGVSSLGVEADVTKSSEVARAVATVVHKLGIPDVLHNNVGSPRLGSILETEPDAWRASVELNLTSAYLTCRETLPHMLEARRGVIINVSSLASIRDTGYVYPAYNAAKAGLNQLTVSLALAYAKQGIRANAILPGLINTPLVTQQITEDAQALAARHEMSPTGRMGSPEDIANAAVFLASDKASYINGVCLPVDGGLSMSCIR